MLGMCDEEDYTPREHGRDHNVPFQPDDDWDYEVEEEEDEDEDESWKVN